MGQREQLVKCALGLRSAAIDARVFPARHLHLPSLRRLRLANLRMFWGTLPDLAGLPALEALSLQVATRRLFVCLFVVARGAICEAIDSSRARRR